MDSRSGADLATLALLTEPVRRRLFQHVVARHPDPVSRDEAAKAAKVSRKLAAFHLDRLVEAGLIKASFGRVGQRAGPGAGRPAKLYTKADYDLRVLLPERRYDFAAEIFARAAEDPQARRRVQDEARVEGQTIGQAARGSDGPVSVDGLVKVLDAHGFDPVVAGSVVRLRNCPFHALAQQHRDLVCGMNLSLMQGITDGFGVQVSASLDRQPGYCCVVFEFQGAAPKASSTRKPRLPGWVRLLVRE